MNQAWHVHHSIANICFVFSDFGPRSLASTCAATSFKDLPWLSRNSLRSSISFAILEAEPFFFLPSPTPRCSRRCSSFVFSSIWLSDPSKEWEWYWVNCAPGSDGVTLKGCSALNVVSCLIWVCNDGSRMKFWFGFVSCCSDRVIISSGVYDNDAIGVCVFRGTNCCEGSAICSYCWIGWVLADATLVVDAQDLGLRQLLEPEVLDRGLGACGAIPVAPMRSKLCWLAECGQWFTGLDRRTENMAPMKKNWSKVDPKSQRWIFSNCFVSPASVVCRVLRQWVAGEIHRVNSNEK